MVPRFLVCTNRMALPVTRMGGSGLEHGVIRYSTGDVKFVIAIRTSRCHIEREVAYMSLEFKEEIALEI